MLGKLVDIGLGARVDQSCRGDPVAARSAPDAKVDPPREEGVENAELLGHFQRRVVGEHHATTSHAYGVGGAGYLADQHLGAGACKCTGVVVLSYPVAAVAQTLDDLGQTHCLPEGVGGRTALAHGGLVYHAKLEPARQPCYRSVPGAMGQRRATRLTMRFIRVSKFLEALSQPEDLGLGQGLP